MWYHADGNRKSNRLEHKLMTSNCQAYVLAAFWCTHDWHDLNSCLTRREPCCCCCCCWCGSMRRRTGSLAAAPTRRRGDEERPSEVPPRVPTAGGVVKAARHGRMSAPRPHRLATASPGWVSNEFARGRLRRCGGTASRRPTRFSNDELTRRAGDRRSSRRGLAASRRQTAGTSSLTRRRSSSSSSS